MKDPLTITQMSPRLRVSYWHYVTHKTADVTDTLGFYDLTPEEQQVMHKVHERFCRKLNNPDHELIGRSIIRQTWFATANKPKNRGTLRRNKREALLDFHLGMHWRKRPVIMAGLATGDQETLLSIRKMIGGRIKGERLQLWKNRISELEYAKALKDSQLWHKTALYGCSGELEADYMDGRAIAKMAANRGHDHNPASRTTHWSHYSWLNYGTDGGGQAETRFAIVGSLPSLVCRQITRLGSTERNGGHIHLNAKEPEIGERVYNAMRYHLSWFRWLVPSHRRNNRFAAVTDTPQTFENARRRKYAAISANTWDRTHTIEVRLWPTSDDPSDWTGRRDLMQAIAKWSETIPRPVDEAGIFPAPINQQTQVKAWPEFYRWAAVNAPEGLRYALKVLRKKARRTRRDLDQTMAAELWENFLSSGVTVRGFRRRSRISERQSAVAVAETH